MSNPRKVDVATEADWAFFSDTSAMRAVKRAAERAAFEFEHVEYDDAYQDALLWLAVRPERYERAREEEDFLSLGSDIYANALRPDAMAEAERGHTFVSKEAIEELQGWEF